MAIGGHQLPINATDVWLTPPAILAALGKFDLDPCAAPPPQPWATADVMYALPQDGLSLPWEGRVWLNPPYGGPSLVTPWMSKMAQHGRGVALIFARTETAMFFEHVWRRASGLLFVEGRLHFHHADGSRAKANGGAPSVLISYGDDDRDILATAEIGGAFVPLQLPRSYLFAALETSWKDAVIGWVRAQPGPVRVADLYRALIDHPKTKGKQHWRAKIRQTLQRHAKAIGKDQWVAA